MIILAASGHQRGLSTAVTTLSDNFNRADEDPMNSNWAQFQTVGADYWRVSSNVARMDGPGGEATNQAYCLYKTQAPDADQSVQIGRVGATQGQNCWFGLLARSPSYDNSQNCYVAFLTTDGGSVWAYYIGKLVSDVWTTLATGSASNKTTLRLDVAGANPATLTLYGDGEQLGQTTDSDLDDGLYVGFVGTAVGANIMEVDDWSASAI